ncbi:MAG: class IIb bacteriocin, lactobin A/cerein 7B family [Pseudomonadales bacterium]|nr:class IIb bacteriocin, lactobin A/cerein 7B family [Pseudomonadales bacterium]MBO6594831.1 class IIb bacteriocin, lactobin A/cerein 7B family [Pseudomonadales bacterium]MBO6821609.1 class IIb bacteriocin, lactobin A/cerein 7B family [Pseudomonadales bacterium]
MRELTHEEMSQVTGGLGPLAIIAIDLALNAAFIGATAVVSSDYFTQPQVNKK